MGGETSELWKTLEPLFSGIGAALAEFVDEIFPELQRTWEVVSGRIEEATSNFATFWDEHWGTIKKVLDAAIVLITTAIDVAFSSFKTIIKVALNVMQGDWEGAWDAIKDHFGTVWEGVQRIADAALPLLEEALGTAWGGIKTAAASAWQGIADAITGAFRSITQPIRDVIDGVMRTIQPALGAIEKIAGFSVPDFSDVLAELCGTSKVPLRKAAFARIDSGRPLEAGGGTLRWLVPPDLLKSQASDKT